MKKAVPVSCVGVRDYQGCEPVVKLLRKKVEEKTAEYRRQVEEVRAAEEAAGGDAVASAAGAVAAAESVAGDVKHF